MAICEILLLEPVTNLGREGERVHVKAGYARNFLVPRKKALAFNRANERQVQSLIRLREERERRERESAAGLAKQFDGLRVVVAVKTGENGKLFGSVTAMELLEKLAEKGISLERQQLQLEQPLKELGQHAVGVRLHRDVQASFTVEIVSENPIILATGN
ncbi:MAG: 50S ribosomal protein L9 [Puniceicoccales bacterium]|jgi:large subunit ribosomal protein L9|nr:50S ribosomal protein L9 [Puniceicoccales bacterium]